MKLVSQLISATAFVICLSVSVFAQVGDNPFLLERGANEFGGVGVTPLGLQLDFANGSKVHPFVHVNGGLLWFNKSVPIEDAGDFAFVGETGGGVRIFTSEKRAVSVGVRFHHISNGDIVGSNRGLNQFVIYAGFSIFK